MTISVASSPHAAVIDDIYARLVALGQGRSDEEAHARLAALVLVLINQIPDQRTVFAAIDLVEKAFEQPAPLG